MDGPDWVILLMYGSHDMRHTGFHRLTVVNGAPRFWGVTSSQIYFFFNVILSFSKVDIIVIRNGKPCSFL